MNATVDQLNDQRDRRRRRRRVGIVVAIVLLAGFAGGAIWAIPVIQRDLEAKVDRRLAAEGITGVIVSFSGQDATLRCVSVRADVAAVRAATLDVTGVRVVKFDPTCTGITAPANTDTAGSPAQGATDGSVVRTPITPVVRIGIDGKVDVSGTVSSTDQGYRVVNAVTDAYGAANVTATLTVGSGAGTQSDKLVDQLASLVSVFAGRLRAGEAGVVDNKLYLKGITADEAALGALTDAAGLAGVASGDIALAVDKPSTAAGIKVAAVLADGQLTITGTVTTDAQQKVLIRSANDVLNSANVTNELQVQAGANPKDPSVDELAVDHVAVLIAAMPTNLLSGEIGFDGTKLSAKGVYLDDATKAAFQDAATKVGVTAVLEQRPVATADNAAAVQKQLNEYVAANPILFESNQAVLVPAAELVLDRVATIAKQFAGTTIEVQGHTDSTGDLRRNLTLSQGRADAVVAALITRAVPAAQLVGQGYGETKPKVPNISPTNRATNRRVEFAVSVS